MDVTTHMFNPIEITESHKMTQQDASNRTTVDSGALKLALNVLRRAGKNEVADALEEAAIRGQSALAEQDDSVEVTSNEDCPCCGEGKLVYTYCNSCGTDLAHPRKAEQDDTLTAADYEEVLADHRRLVRELDQAINGSNAAEQASLCDIVAQVKRQGLVAEQDEEAVATVTIANGFHGYEYGISLEGGKLSSGEEFDAWLYKTFGGQGTFKLYTRPAPKTYTEQDIDVAIGAVDWANTSWQQAAVEAKKLIMRFVGSQVKVEVKRLSEDEIIAIMDNNGAGWWAKHNLEFDYHGFANALMNKMTGGGR